MSDQYKSAGVDIDKGQETVERLKKHVRKTFRPGMLAGIGGFSGLFALPKMEEPILVSGTDGVGTKILLATELNTYKYIGQDLVAMCVNDIITSGAEPLFFLDYIATGKLEPSVVEAIVESIANACKECGCALLGGETAEMPGLYTKGNLDLAGFAVGVVEKEHLLLPGQTSNGDVLIGIASNGAHANGFSLIRKIIKDHRIDLSQKPNGSEKTWGELLLAPTTLYSRCIQDLHKNLHIKGLSHITGGGFYENIPRMLAPKQGVKITLSSWEVPFIFKALQSIEAMDTKTLFSVFNMGIGMVVAVSKQDVTQALEIIHRYHNATVIGEITSEVGVILL